MSTSPPDSTSTVTTGPAPFPEAMCSTRYRSMIGCTAIATTLVDGGASRYLTKCARPILVCS